MSDITAEELARIREEVGIIEPTDEEIQEIYDLWGTAPGVIASIFRSRLAILIRTPASFSADGYSQSTAANIQYLRDQIRIFDQEHQAITGEGPWAVNLDLVRVQASSR